MTYNTLLYEKEDGIGIVTINRPASLNALNGEVYTELYELFQEIEKDARCGWSSLPAAARRLLSPAPISWRCSHRVACEINSFIGKSQDSLRPDLYPEQAGYCRHQRLRPRRRL